VEGNHDAEFGMDDYSLDTHALEGMFLNSFQQDDLKDNAHNVNMFFEIWKSTFAIPLVGHGSIFLAFDQVLRNTWSYLTVLDFNSLSKMERQAKQRSRDIGPLLGPF
jgi:hypothetical protein